MADEDDEEEAKKKEMQLLLAGFLKLKTRRESEKTHLNELKSDIQWRQLMREAKTKDLQETLHLMKQSFIKAVDYKDSIIAALEKEIEEAEVQNMWTACNHMHSLEELIAVEQQRSKRLQEQYENDLNQLKETFKGIKKEIETKVKVEMGHFKDLDFIEDAVFQDFSEKAKTQFTLMLEDTNEEVAKEKADIFGAFDSNISATWKRFQTALVKYLEDAEMMEKLFMELKQEYKESMLDTLQDKKVTEELRKSIPQLKAQIEQRQRDHKERVQKVLAGNEEFYTSAADLKDKMSRIRRHDKMSLTKLVVNSTSAIQELQKLESKGESIMRLYKRCKKLEAEIGIGGIVSEEPVLTPEEQEEVEKNFEFQLPDNGSGKEHDESFEYVGLLQRFWEKHNRVVLQNLALRRELNDLEILHMQLKSDMSKFFKKVAEGNVDSLLKISSELHKPVVQEAALLAKNLPNSRV